MEELKVNSNFVESKVTISLKFPRENWTYLDDFPIIRKCRCRLQRAVCGSTCQDCKETFRLYWQSKAYGAVRARDESMIPSLFDRAYVPRARDAIVQR